MSISRSIFPPKDDIEDMYPLTPMQHGILFHALRDERSGPYVEQFIYDSCLPPNLELLAASWTAVVKRHPALRTAFFWEGLDEPLQVVVKSCTVAVDLIDLRRRPREQVEDELCNFIAEDRARGFALGDAPLMRLTLLQHDLGCILVWSLHHLIMDGWSMPITIGEVADHYRASCAGVVPELPTPRPFRDYVVWLGELLSPDTEHFWHDQMRGGQAKAYTVRTPGLAPEQRGTAALGRAFHNLSPILSSSLVKLARDARVTLSIVFQAAWALLIARHTDTQDVIFGMTVSGRPADLPKAEAIVGVFINTIPRRIEVDDAASLRLWLRNIQSGYLDTLPYQHASLAAIKKYAGIPSEVPLFDSIVIFENYPSENPVFDLGDGIILTVREIIEDSAYPLTLSVLPRKPSIGLQLLYDTQIFSDESTKTIMGRFETVLSSLTAVDLDVEVGRLGVLSDEAGRIVASMQDPAELPTAVLMKLPGTLLTRRHVYVLDSRREIMPVGVVGAVYATGPKWRFGRDRTGDGEVGGCYETGLRGYRTPDGILELVEVQGLVGSKAQQESSVAGRAVYKTDFFQRPAARLLRDLWAEALEQTIVSPDIDFFRSGGDSLVAVRLIGKIRVAFETPIPVIAIFEDRSLVKLLRRIDEQLGGEAWADRAALAWQ